MDHKKKISVVYDWLDKWGGVERVLLTLHEIFPQAIFYTSYYDSEQATWAKNLKIKTSFIQNFPSFVRRSRIVCFPFYPYAFETFDFSNFDLVISVTSAFAKSIITRPDTRNICYLLTPTRYLWSHSKNYFGNKLINSVLAPYLANLRKWDFIAAQRPDKIISISETVSERCQKYYQRKSEVIYPPFDVEYWNKIKSNIKHQKSKLQIKYQKYLLCVSRLEPYKKVDLVIQLINQLSQRLIIVGEGSQLSQLKKMANNNILFLSKLSDRDLGYLYSRAEGLIMPQEEDFGYVSLEAQFFGCPVIAYKKGGADETIIEGKTGIFFGEQTVESLKKAILRYNMVKYELKQNVQSFGLKNIERFAKEKFIKKLMSNITV